jgi:hypothetical protein
MELWLLQDPAPRRPEAEQHHRMTAERQHAAGKGHEQPGTEPGAGGGQRVVLAGGVDHGGWLGRACPSRPRSPLTTAATAAATMVVYAPPLVWPAAVDTYRVTR